jgi:serine/threonine protein kinase
VTRHLEAEMEPTFFGGRYTLLRKLAVGGMAEIFLARQAAMAGFEKEVVIKRLRTELADDPRIIEMFLDEAKIGAQLNHPNIVHVYDVDEHDGIPYIAMEYIVGEELNELCRRGISHGRFLPIEHAVELIRQAAAGMGYFHAKRSSPSSGSGTSLANQPLDIVHLDISPTNLLVTQDGFLKVIDFGIAKSRGQGSTRSEVLPGKLSYMSPEQAARKPVDHRSDVFSLGIVLYEITVGKRLYRGPAQEVVQKLIEGGIEPPTFARRNFPPALESIVMRTLEKHPEDRYQSAYDLADDLETFLHNEKLHSGPVRIARYLDLLSIAGGGPGRPELLSEADQRVGDKDLDFDTQMFDGFVPGQAEQWEDIEQPDTDVAAALQIELAELRALRTPVPMRSIDAPRSPSGALRGPAEPELAIPPDGDGPSTNPVPRTAPEELDAPTRTQLPLPPARPTPTPEDLLAPPPAPVRKPTVPPPLSAMPPRRDAAPVAVIDTPSIGAAYLQRKSGASRLPWLVVAILALAVIGLIAYIVVK